MVKIKGSENEDPLPGMDLQMKPPTPAGNAPQKTPKAKLTRDERLERNKIMKNIVVISFSFTCLFTSLGGIAELQSSINKKLGTISLMIIYVALVFSSIFLPTIVLKNLKMKWTLTLSMLAYSTYIAAQFYPTYATLIPAALILGLAAGPLWSAKCTYLTVAGEQYGQITGEDVKLVITKFFGIFFLFFHLSQVIGSLISSTVLSIGNNNLSRSDEFLENCGINFCPSFLENLTSNARNVNDSMNPEPDEKLDITLLASIYMAISLLAAALVAGFVDNLPEDPDSKGSSSDDKSTLEGLIAAIKHLKNPYQVLIIPLTFWSGIEQAFIGSEITAAFITCGLGVHMVGYVMICYGVFDAILSYGFTSLVKITGRVPIFLLAASVNVGIFIYMFLWEPNPGDVIPFFAVTALWGVSDAIWQTQVNAFYGVIFHGNTEAAFSNYKLWESVGFMFAYCISAAICVEAKVFINIGVLAAGMIGYLAIEIWEVVRNRSS